MHTIRLKSKWSSTLEVEKINSQAQERGLQQHTKSTPTNTQQIHSRGKITGKKYASQNSRNPIILKSSKIIIVKINYSPYNLQKALIHAQLGGGWKGSPLLKHYLRYMCRWQWQQGEEKYIEPSQAPTKKAKK